MTTVLSIPWMPERAWTVARADCAISGLTRSDYSPIYVQPDPPCEPSGEFADCLPRYVMWRECPRNPDFLGGEPRIVWTRGEGWTFRDECTVPPPVPPVGICFSWYQGSESSTVTFACTIAEEMIGCTLTFDFGDGSQSYTLGPIQEVDLGLQQWNHNYSNPNGTYTGTLTITGNGTFDGSEEATFTLNFGAGSTGDSFSCYQWVYATVMCNGSPVGAGYSVDFWMDGDGPPNDPWFTVQTDANGVAKLQFYPMQFSQVFASASGLCSGASSSGDASATIDENPEPLTINLVAV